MADDELHDQAHYAAKNVASTIDVIYTPEAAPKLKDLARAAIVAIETLVEGDLRHHASDHDRRAALRHPGVRLAGGEFEEPLA